MNRPFAAAVLAPCFVSAAASAQAPGDLVHQYAGALPGPFISCDVGYEWYVGVHADGSLGSFGPGAPTTPAPPGPFKVVDLALNTLSWGVLLRQDGSAAYWGIAPLQDALQPPAGPFVAVSAGAWHGLGLRPDGTVVQWGNQADPPPGAYTAVAAGQDYSLALRDDGVIIAWGTNTGHGILNPPPGTYRAIAAGQLHAMALRDDGTLVAWGYPGLPHQGSRLVVPPGVFVEIAAGGFNAARRADGTVALSISGQISEFPGDFGMIAAGLNYFVGIAGCYANCDGGTVAPVLNVGDFTCFLQRFAAGEGYANCDNSTTAPVLNVGDFTCFLQQFAAGCP